CRDRDGVYASAARRGVPDALQVADRWHLTHNLADALERYAVRILATLRKELKAVAPLPTSIPPAHSPGRLAVRTQQRHAEIHELRAGGLSLSAIARQLRLERKTVRRYARAQLAADLVSSSGRRASALDPYRPYLAGRWRQGQHVAAYLFDEVRQEGYRGSV